MDYILHLSTGSKMYDPDVASNKLFQTNTDEDEVIFVDHSLRLMKLNDP